MESHFFGIFPGVFRKDILTKNQDILNFEKLFNQTKFIGGFHQTNRTFYT